VNLKVEPAFDGLRAIGDFADLSAASASPDTL